MKVHHVCKNYFNAFEELGSKNSSSTKTLAALKVLSYLTLVAPLIMGIAYGIAKLAGRAAKKSSSSDLDNRTDQAASKMLGSKQAASIKPQGPSQENDPPFHKGAYLSLHDALNGINPLSQMEKDSARCGAHALKNAIAVLEYKEKEKDHKSPSQSDLLAKLQLRLSDEEFFAEINKSFGENISKDLTIEELSLKSIELAKKYSINLESLTILHYPSSSHAFEESLGEPPNSFCLQYLINLLQIHDQVSRKEDFHHVFVLGTADHWSVLILEQKDQQLAWIPLNSVPGKKRDDFLTHQRTISLLFSDKMPRELLCEKFIKSLTSFIGTLETQLAANPKCPQVKEATKALINTFLRLREMTSESENTRVQLDFDTKEQVLALIDIFPPENQQELLKMLPVHE